MIGEPQNKSAQVKDTCYFES